MKVTTQRELIRALPRRWRNTYKPFSGVPAIMYPGNKKGSPIPNKRDVADKLDLIDVETATPEEIGDIIGNTSWTRLTCDQCREECERVISVGEEPNYDSNTASLCPSCLSQAALTLANSI